MQPSTAPNRSLILGILAGLATPFIAWLAVNVVKLTGLGAALPHDGWLVMAAAIAGLKVRKVGLAATGVVAGAIWAFMDSRLFNVSLLGELVEATSLAFVGLAVGLAISTILERRVSAESTRTL